MFRMEPKPVKDVADRDERIVLALETIADRLDQILNLAIAALRSDELRAPPTNTASPFNPRRR